MLKKWLKHWGFHTPQRTGKRTYLLIQNRKVEEVHKWYKLVEYKQIILENISPLLILIKLVKRKTRVRAGASIMLLNIRK